MKRKGHDPDARDMKTVVTMHNVVNERSWVELKRWEKEFHFDCDNIKLKRFQQVHYYNSLFKLKNPISQIIIGESPMIRLQRLILNI